MDGSRCSTVNAADRFGCSNCGLLRHDAATFGSSAEAGSPAWPTEQPTEPAPVCIRLARLADRAADGPTSRSGRADVADRAAAGPPAPPPAYLTSSEADAGWVPRTATREQRRTARTPLATDPDRLGDVAVIVGGGAVAGWYFNASRSSTGEITKAGDMTAADLRVGDCFDLKDPAANESRGCGRRSVQPSPTSSRCSSSGRCRQAIPGRERVRDLRHPTTAIRRSPPYIGKVLHRVRRCRCTGACPDETRDGAPATRSVHVPCAYATRAGGHARRQSLPKGS